MHCILCSIGLRLKDSIRKASNFKVWCLAQLDLTEKHHCQSDAFWQQFMLILMVREPLFLFLVICFLSSLHPFRCTLNTVGLRDSLRKDKGSGHLISYLNAKKLPEVSASWKLLLKSKFKPRIKVNINFQSYILICINHFYWPWWYAPNHSFHDNSWMFIENHFFNSTYCMQE